MYVPVNPIEALLAKKQLQEAILSVLTCLAFRGFGHGKGFLIFQASYCFSHSFDTFTHWVRTTEHPFRRISLSQTLAPFGYSIRDPHLKEAQASGAQSSVPRRAKGGLAPP